MFDYKLIEAMATVFNEGGFDKAARALHLTQSAVSQRVKLLEEQAGQVLLVRSTPPGVTPGGRRMLRHYLKVKKLEDDLIGEFGSPDEKVFASLAIGVNADSLATWFLDAVGSFIGDEKVILDIRTDDQEQTHRMLRDGEVVGCISARKQPMQGCRTVYLGKMDYRLFATPAFVEKWFPDGFNLKSVLAAPVLIFNRKDTLHNKLFIYLWARYRHRCPRIMSPPRRSSPTLFHPDLPTECCRPNKVAHWKKPVTLPTWRPAAKWRSNCTGTAGTWNHAC